MILPSDKEKLVLPENLPLPGRFYAFGALTGSPGQRAVKRVCVCVLVCSLLICRSICFAFDLCDRLGQWLF